MTQLGWGSQEPPLDFHTVSHCCLDASDKSCLASWGKDICSVICDGQTEPETDSEFLCLPVGQCGGQSRRLGVPRPGLLPTPPLAHTLTLAKAALPHPFYLHSHS